MGLHNGDELQKYVRKDSGLWKQEQGRDTGHHFRKMTGEWQCTSVVQTFVLGSRRHLENWCSSASRRGCRTAFQKLNRDGFET